MSKKDFTKATANAAERFFTHTNENPEQAPAFNALNAQNDKLRKKHVTNKSKHYDERGKRGERFGLLMDKNLKDDLRNLANASGSRSVNDLIITVLLDYVEMPENKKVLEEFMRLQNDE